VGVESEMKNDECKMTNDVIVESEMDEIATQRGRGEANGYGKPSPLRGLLPIQGVGFPAPHGGAGAGSTDAGVGTTNTEDLPIEE